MLTHIKFGEIKMGRGVQKKYLTTLLMIATFLAALVFSTTPLTLAAPMQETSYPTIKSTIQPITTQTKSPSPTDIVIIFDQSHDQYYDASKLDKFIEYLRTKGQVIINNDTITDELLKNATLLIIPNPGKDFLSNETEAIKSFIDNGGSLLIMGNFYYYFEPDQLNNITGSYGIYWNDTEVYDETNYGYKPNYPIIYTWANNTIANIITAGVVDTKYYRGCSLYLTGDAVPIGTGDNDTYAINATGDPVVNGTDVIVYAAVNIWGGGRIFACGSSGMFITSYGYFDYNKVFVENVIMWLLRERSVIVFDQGHDQYYDADKLSNFISLLREHREEVYINNGSITEMLLAAADILIIPNPGKAFTTEEIQLIHDFIAANGSLLIMGNYYYYFEPGYVTSITSSYGIYWNDTQVRDPTNYTKYDYYPIIHTWVNNTIANIITTGVTSVKYPRGCSLYLTGDAVPIGTGDNDTYAEDENGIHVVSGTDVIVFGAVDLSVGGRIFASGSSAMFAWTNIYENDTETFVRNVIAWLEEEIKAKPPAVFIDTFEVSKTFIPYRDNATVTLIIRNTGESAAEDVNVTLTLPYVCAMVEGNETIFVGNMTAGNVTTITWIINGTLIGKGTIYVKVESKNAGSADAEIDVEVVPDIAIDLVAEPAVLLLAEQSWTIINATLTNIATLTTHGVNVTLQLPSGLTTEEATTITIGDMESGNVTIITWNVTITAAKAYEVTLVVETEDGGTSSASTGIFAVTEKIIVFDQGHGQYIDAEKASKFIDLLKDYGEVYINNGTISEAMLTATELLILFNPEEDVGLAEEEINAIKDYLENGGALLIAGTYYAYFSPEYFNPITEDYGIKWYDGDIYDPDDYPEEYWYFFPYLYNFADNLIAKQLTSGVESVQFAGTPLNVSSPAVPVVLGNPDEPNHTYAIEVVDSEERIIANGSDVVAIAAVNLTGGGRIVASGSDYLFRSDRYGFYDHNEKFIKNAIAWLLNLQRLDVTITVPAEVQVGEEFNVTVTISNLGITNITGVTATITVPEGIVLVKPTEASISVGVVKAGEDKVIYWTVKAEKEGTYTFTIEVTSENYPKITKTSAAVSVVKAPFWTPTMIAMVAGGVAAAVIIVIMLYFVRKRGVP